MRKGSGRFSNTHRLCISCAPLRRSLPTTPSLLAPFSLILALRLPLCSLPSYGPFLSTNSRVHRQGLGVVHRRWDCRKSESDVVEAREVWKIESSGGEKAVDIGGVGKSMVVVVAALERSCVGGDGREGAVCWAVVGELEARNEEEGELETCKCVCNTVRARRGSAVCGCMHASLACESASCITGRVIPCILIFSVWRVCYASAMLADLMRNHRREFSTILHLLFGRYRYG